MALHVHNTLTKRKEPFHPAQPKVVRIYTCGLTVYAPMHIGHARTYCFWDLFRRYLEYRGYHVVSVINYTDIDDRIMARLSVARALPAIRKRRARRPALLEPLLDRSTWPSATSPLSAATAACCTSRTTRSTRALPTSSTSRSTSPRSCSSRDTPTRWTARCSTRSRASRAYGQLSGRTVDEQEIGASGRVTEDVARKHHPADFTLWKPTEGGQPSWETGHPAWPQGRPGWHIECSAMSTALLGQHFDVHGGGIDNMFPHHENEIAQSEPLCGRPWVRYWLHPEHLDLRGEKMSKSLGNVIGIDELLEGHRHDEVRWFYATNHYRTKLPFSDDLIGSAKEGYGKITRLLRLLEEKLMGAEGVEAGVPAAGEYASQRPDTERWPRLRHYYTYGKYGEITARFMQRFREALDDDLNSPQATAALFDYVGELYSAGIGDAAVARPSVAAKNEAGGHGGAAVSGRQTEEAGTEARPIGTADLLAAYRCLARHLYVLGCEFPNETLYPQLAMECAPGSAAAGGSEQPYKDFIQRLLDQRLQARQAKDFARADLIRDMLAQAGLTVEDTAQGARWQLP